MRIHIVDTNVPRPFWAKGELVISMDEYAHVIKKLKGRVSTGLVLCSEEDFEIRNADAGFEGKQFAFPRENYERPCLTDGAMFHTAVDATGIEVRFDMPEGKPLDIGKSEAKVLTDDLHDAIESVMAKFFK
jgi:hypothetical protein